MKRKNVIFCLFGLFVICFIMFTGCEPTTGGNNNPGGTENGTPVAADYNIGNLTQTEGSVTSVTITPKSGKSGGARTVYYDGNTAVPQTQGEYTVTFDVAAATGWDAVTGLFAGTLTVNSTGNNPGNTGRKLGFLELARMDIEDANNLVITKNPETSKDELYKTTDSGKVQEVTYTYKDEYDNVVIEDAAGNVTVEDKDGNDITDNIEGDLETPRDALIPSAVFILNDNYFIVSYGSKGNFLVNSNTGACYKYTNDMPSLDENYFGEKGNITSDNVGNIFFISSQKLKKLSVSNINSINISTVSAPSDNVIFFEVDQAGNIIYLGRDNTGEVLRYRKENGGYEVLSGIASSQTSVWADFSGNLYYQTWARSDIKKIIAEPFSIIDYADFNYYGPSRILKIKNKNRIIGVGWSDFQRRIYEIYNGITDQARFICEISAFDLVSIKISHPSDNFYYLVGTSTGSTPKNVLIRVDPADNNYSQILDGGYDIYKMTVSPDDVVTFNALRMSDGAIVLGEISATGVVRILDATLTNEVVVLERIR